MKKTLILLSLSVLSVSLVTAVSADSSQTGSTPAEKPSGPPSKLSIVGKNTASAPSSASADVFVEAASHKGEDWLVVPPGTSAVQIVKAKAEGVIERVDLRTASDTPGTVVLVVNDVVYSGERTARNRDGYVSASFEAYALSVKKDDIVLVGIFVPDDAPSVKVSCDAAGRYGDGEPHFVQHIEDLDRVVEGVDLSFSVSVRQTRTLAGSEKTGGFWAAVKFWD